MLRQSKNDVDCVLHERAVGLEWFMLYMFVWCYVKKLSRHFHTKHCASNNKFKKKMKMKMKKQRKEKKKTTLEVRWKN